MFVFKLTHEVIPDEPRDESEHEGHYYDDKLLHCYTPTHMERGITRCAQPSLGDLTEFSARVTVGVMAIRPSAHCQRTPILNFAK